MICTSSQNFERAISTDQNRVSQKLSLHNLKLRNRRTRTSIYRENESSSHGTVHASVVEEEKKEQKEDKEGGGRRNDFFKQNIGYIALK
jgi:hypothetical protein